MTGRPLQKITCNLFLGDWDKLRAIAPTIGAGGVIRALVASFIERTESGMTSTSDAAKAVLEEISE